eukprot:scaffold1016_cov175-Ochromonas_danica.AAC.22
MVRNVANVTATEIQNPRIPAAVSHFPRNTTIDTNNTNNETIERKREMASFDHAQYNMLVSLRQSMDRMKRSVSAVNEIAREHHLQGVFQSLAQPGTMRQVLFPGTPAEVLKTLPQNLHEVLLWEELTLDLPAIAKSACTVLENIKAKGAKLGDVMDPMTERVLLPQIAQEALARAIIEGVRQLNRHVSQVVAQAVTEIAAAEAPQAQEDQIDDDVIDSLLSFGYGIQREFVGKEWADVIRSDLNRFLRDEKMSDIDDKGEVMVPGQQTVSSSSSSSSAARTSTEGLTPSKISWIESGEEGFSARYPALCEAVRLLHALPFELNLKCGFPEMSLLEPMRGCTLLVYYPPGAKQSLRLDCRDDKKHLDSGIRITCTFHLCAEIKEDSEERGGQEGEGGEGSEGGGGGQLLFESRHCDPLRLPLEDDL